MMHRLIRRTPARVFGIITATMSGDIISITVPFTGGNVLICWRVKSKQR